MKSSEFAIVIMVYLLYKVEAHVYNASTVAILMSSELEIEHVLERKYRTLPALDMLPSCK